MRVGLVGLGLIGQERLKAFRRIRGRRRDVEIVGVVDPHNADAKYLASRAGSRVFASIAELIENHPDWVFVAAPHDYAVEAVTALLRANVAAFVEKPLGRSASEAEQLVALCRDERQLRVGLNYRFYQGIGALLSDVRSGVFGRLISVNAIIGHGGAPQMERSWKLDPVRAGGGALIDPGVHLLDLSLIIANGRLDPITGATWSGFWRTGIEEECHLLMAGPDLLLVNLQMSIVRWRSTFRLEVNGEDGYGVVEGRGRSYGKQIYRRGRRWGWREARSQRASEEFVVRTAGEDVFERETEAVLFPDQSQGLTPASGAEALAVMHLLERCRSAVGIGKNVVE